MTTYIITFEAALENTRKKLRTLMKEFPSYCPINKHCWAIVSKDQAPDVRDKLVSVLKKGDRIFVIRSGTASAWNNAYGDSNNEWLKKNL